MWGQVGHGTDSVHPRGTAAALGDEEIEKEPEQPQELEELVEDPPEDPIGRGECSLILQAFDADCGEPIDARADLWRLNAPGNEHWRAGDQLQASVKIDANAGILLPRIYKISI